MTNEMKETVERVRKQVRCSHPQVPVVTGADAALMLEIIDKLVKDVDEAYEAMRRVRDLADKSMTLM
jgi:hypothetical protein